jgi:very-long-chain enoyl-CoA reductase
MKIRIRNALDFVKYSETEIDSQTNIPFRQIKSLIEEKLNSKTNSNKIRYTLVKGETFKTITDYNKSLDQLNFSEKDAILVEPIVRLELPTFWNTVISYLGPPLVFSYFFLFSENLYLIQILSVLLIYAHFFRRIYEGVFVFKWGREYLPAFDLIGVSLYYWILNGYLIGNSIFSQDYSKFTHLDFIRVILFTILFFYCEFSNCKCHLYLADLKSKNNGQRAIPEAGVYKYVSCAHYFWELLSWVCFAFVTTTLTSYLFVLFSFASMSFMARDKHLALKKYFGDRYPKDKKSFIPYLF